MPGKDEKGKTPVQPIHKDTVSACPVVALIVYAVLGTRRDRQELCMVSLASTSSRKGDVFMK